MLHERVSRVMVIGLDCVPPELAFERYLERMPHLAGLIRRGLHGPLRSSFPPITLPAWASMVTGRDAGELGIYGFRKREPGSYGMCLQDAGALDAPAVWDVLGAAGRHVSVLFVPPSYPPRALHGEHVGCFLTPDADAEHTYPPPLKGELAARFGPYIPDVAHVGARADGDLLERLEAMTRQHFAMIRHVWTTRDPDFLMGVCIGPDRFHHAFYRHLDPSHPQAASHPQLGDVGARFYAMLDEQLGELLSEVDDDTSVLVVSDHGARPLEGALRLNNWLSEHGYLSWRPDASDSQPLWQRIDWPRTRAWAEGGYYARVFLNVRGREPQGCVEPADYPSTREALRYAISQIGGPEGRAWSNQVETPEALYREVRGQAPDLLAVFDDLRIRPLASRGDGGLYSAGDDRGNDACNHAWHGIAVLSGAGVPTAGVLRGAELRDVGATVLALSGVPAPAGFGGRDLRGLT